MVTKSDLGKEINGGGEGTIYEVINKPNIVAKIYHDPKNIINLEKNLSYFKKLPKEFVKPLESIKDNKGNIIGFTMDFVPNNYYPISGLKYDTFCQKKKVTEKNKKKVLEKVIESVLKAHKLDIVIGDLNPENILTNGKDIRFIDTAGYQTPNVKHNNILQPEITDWYYNAKVSKESDYFALNVIIFEILSHVHPYKGQHPNFYGKDKLKERMMAKLSVMGNYPKLKIPKAYKPLSIKGVDNFYETFEKAIRNIPSIDKITVTKIDKVYQANSSLTIKQIFKGEINYFHYHNGRFIINNRLHQFKAKGWVNQLFDSDFFGEKLHYSYQKPYLLYNGQNVEKIYKPFQIANKIISFDNNDRLIIYSLDGLVTSIDTLVSKEVREVFTKAFTWNDGIIMNTTKKSFVFSVVNNSLSSFEYDYKILGTKIFDNYGSFKFKVGKTIKYGYFNLKNNSNLIKETDDYRHSTSNGSLIFEPDDDKINVLRTYDFEVVTTIDCNIVNKYSELYWNVNGIIVRNVDSVYIINTK